MNSVLIGIIKFDEILTDAKQNDRITPDLVT